QRDKRQRDRRRGWPERRPRCFGGNGFGCRYGIGLRDDRVAAGNRSCPAEGERANDPRNEEQRGEEQNTERVTARRGVDAERNGGYPRNDDEQLRLGREHSAPTSGSRRQATSKATRW